jgi:hypothetical protein
VFDFRIPAAPVKVKTLEDRINVVWERGAEEGIDDRAGCGGLAKTQCPLIEHGTDWHGTIPHSVLVRVISWVTLIRKAHVQLFGAMV